MFLYYHHIVLYDFLLSYFIAMKKVLGLVTLVAVVTAGSFTFAFPGQWAGGEGRGEHHEEVRAAIEANDYSLLPTEVQEKISEEQFAEKVEHHADMEENKAAVEEAVANNDFAAFQALHEAKRAEMEAKRQERIDAGEDVKEPREGSEELTDEEKEAKMRERFDEMVAYYDENGELPEMEHKGKKGMDWGKRKSRFGAAHKGIVKNVIANVNPDRLAAALDRIDDKIENIEANDALDEDQKDLILDLLAGIEEMIEEVLAE